MGRLVEVSTRRRLAESTTDHASRKIAGHSSVVPFEAAASSSATRREYDRSSISIAYLTPSAVHGLSSIQGDGQVSKRRVRTYHRSILHLPIHIDLVRRASTPQSSGRLAPSQVRPSNRSLLRQLHGLPRKRPLYAAFRAVVTRDR